MRRQSWINLLGRTLRTAFDVRNNVSDDVPGKKPRCDQWDRDYVKADRIWGRNGCRQKDAAHNIDSPIAQRTKMIMDRLPRIHPVILPAGA